MNDEEIKEWVKVGTAQGKTVVTVSLVQGRFSAKYAAPAYESTIKAQVLSARKGAHRSLAAIQEAINELDAEGVQ